MGKWDTRGLELANLASSWCNYEGHGVGACIMHPNNRLLSLGYAGPPRDMKDGIVPRVHAELNAILNAPCGLEGWTIYITTPPCLQCAIACIQAGIVRVVALRGPVFPNWRDSQKAARELLGDRYEDAGITAMELVAGRAKSAA